ncbi:MAG: OmpA family protein [Sphingomonadales bacterium]|nr:OmpA family protein [Sphingomonadales bacterium]NCO49499.1 OmpA family protein [Sphingomonadales bacterium]NCO99027.1 OmpA family protein [Sphingomonadales bacterium]NCP26600.1 OmpA family protein [Sphingomonadales bacterium]NCP44632.1 OmpA family protein [Sphingomonadales bacterium]
MKSGSKILTGAAATAILALVGHVATGETFIAGLEQQAQTELAARGLTAADVSFDRSPLSRNAVLHGDLPDSAKQEAMSVVVAIPGVSSVSWKAEEAIEAAKADGDSAPASTAADPDGVTKCQTDVDKIVKAKKISFRSGSAYLSLETRQILDEIAKALKGCDGLSVRVEGHTDDNGNSAVNREMSQERADRIKAALIERGIAETQITATGYGSTRPLAKGSDAAADAQNRRIEFRIGSAEGSAKNDTKAPQGN